tara:strand:+ start:150 stop:896 length:747 start_codon:yes stop_codon:yes gene_type:complete
MIILEAGLNHFGKVKEAREYLNFFLKSNFKKLTFQINTKEYYKKYPFKLPISFYKYALKKTKQKGKKIGLAVCDHRTFKEYKSIKFDFYKLLSIGIDNEILIKDLIDKKKEVYISLGIGTDQKIKRCLKKFGNKCQTNLIYTSLSHNPGDLSLERINYLRKKFKKKIGYGHHYKNELPILLSIYYKVSFFFIYIKKDNIKNSIKYPDDKHAFFFKDLSNLLNSMNEVSKIFKKKKLNTKIKINEKIDL